MGLLFPSTQAEEHDPHWQRRRQRLLILAALAALAAAAAVVWHFIPDRLPATAPEQANGEPGVRQQQIRESELATITPGLPLKDRRPEWIALAQASVERADPWITDWLRVWDRHDGIDATLEHKVQAVEAALMTGNILLARSWYQRLLWQLADPASDFGSIDATLQRRIEVLDLLMIGVVESALALLQETADQRPLTDEERLMQSLVRRELVDGALWAGWAEDLIVLAREDHRGGGLARLQLLRWLESGEAKELPQRALRATGDARLIAAVTGSASVEPAMQEPGRELALWLRDKWRQINSHDSTTSPAVQMALYSLDWALAEQPDEIARVIDQVSLWAVDQDPAEWLFVARWLAQRHEWEQVRQLLAPDRPAPLNPQTLELYWQAMARLQLEEELEQEMGASQSRWPEPLVLLWTVQKSFQAERSETSPLIESMLVRAGRLSKTIEPGWIFDIAQAAFAVDLPGTGANLLLLATAEPANRQRALAMLLDRSLESGNGEEALYVLNQLRQLKSEPGPWHGLWLWFKFMVEDKPGEVLAECRLWKQYLAEDNQAQANFIGAMAATRMDDFATARQWLTRVNPNQLPTRFVVFYLHLLKMLELEDLLVVNMERRWFDEPVYMTHQETFWLQQHQVLEAGLPPDSAPGPLEELPAP